MPRNLTIQHIRTTRANLDSQKTASGLVQGEIYLITDERRMAVGMAVNDYENLAIPIHVGTTAPADTTKLWLDTN